MEAQQPASAAKNEQRLLAAYADRVVRPSPVLMLAACLAGSAAYAYALVKSSNQLGDALRRFEQLHTA